MLKWLAACLIGMGIACGIHPSHLPAPVNHYNGGVILIHTDVGDCTAWRYKAAIFITAAHCVKGVAEGTVYGIRFLVVTRDDNADIAAIYTFLPSSYAFTVAEADPAIQEPVFAVGHALADPELTVTSGVVAHSPVPFEANGAGHLVLDLSLIPGMSGGPILNLKGEVVSIIQDTGVGIGFGADPALLRKFVAAFKD
jgi:S1-C subfamily serine protease